MTFRYYSLALQYTPLHPFEFQYMWKHGPGTALLQKLDDAAMVMQTWWRLQWIPLLRRRKRSAILIQVYIKIDNFVGHWLKEYSTQVRMWQEMARTNGECTMTNLLLLVFLYPKAIWRGFTAWRQWKPIIRMRVTKYFIA